MGACFDESQDYGDGSHGWSARPLGSCPKESVIAPSASHRSHRCTFFQRSRAVYEAGADCRQCLSEDIEFALTGTDRLFLKQFPQIGRWLVSYHLSNFIHQGLVYFR